MGRAPCCDKANVKKGPWSPEEDAKLKSYIEKHGTGGNWIALPQKIGLKRCGKSCRLRWLNYLRPNLKHGGFSEEEDRIICSLYISIGSRWSVIAAQLPGRTDNDIKNYWNTKLKKKLMGKHRKENQNSRNNRGNITGVNVNVITNKQEEEENNINRGNSNYSSLFPAENSTISNAPIQSRWPHVPVQPLQPPPLPCGNQFSGTCNFNDQDSIKKLLVKLGGRFSGDYGYSYHRHDPLVSTVDGINVQFSSGAPSSDQVYQELVDEGEVKFSQGLDLVRGEDGCNFTPAIIEEMENNNNNNNTNYPQRLDELEFFYGENNLIDDKIIGSSFCNQFTNNWGETSNSSIYHQG